VTLTTQVCGRSAPVLRLQSLAILRVYPGKFIMACYLTCATLRQPEVVVEYANCPTSATIPAQSNLTSLDYNVLTVFYVYVLLTSNTYIRSTRLSSETVLGPRVAAPSRNKTSSTSYTRSSLRQVKTSTRRQQVILSPTASRRSSRGRTSRRSRACRTSTSMTSCTTLERLSPIL
jgi:hypothetical protein